MELNQISFVVSTIAIFVQIPVLVNVHTLGISEYGQGIVDVSLQSWIPTVFYVIIVWGFGYLFGGINIKKKYNPDDLQGKDVKYEGCEFD
jgi:hypothetical protein